MIITLVLPCYNPPEGWEQTVCSSWSSFCSRLQDDAELVLVMDGISWGITDESIAFLQKNIPQLKLIKYEQNRGKGYAIRQGVATATGDIIIYTDIDFPYSSESMYTIYHGLRNDEHDVAIGVKNDDYYAHVPPLRRMISRFLRILIRLFLSMPVTDTQCGLKGFKRSVAPLFLATTIDRYLFDLEFVRNCFKNKKYRVKAIPIALNENVQFRSMNYRILFSESVDFIRLLFRAPK
jgi:glycosyltransferase involved in cell wall biosynthesis